MSWATKSTVTEQLYVEPIFTHQRPSVGLYLCLYKDRTGIRLFLQMELCIMLSRNPQDHRPVEIFYMNSVFVNL